MLRFSIALFMYFLSMLVPASSFGQDFFLSGRLETEREVQLPINRFFVGTVELAGEFEVGIDTGGLYSKRLKIADFANRTMYFSFPFEDENALFSMEPHEVAIGPGIHEGQTFKQDFRLFKPSTFAVLLIRKSNDFASSDSCDNFWLVIDKMQSLARLETANFLRSESSLFEFINSANLMLSKSLKHRCSIERVEPALEVLESVMSGERFRGISESKRHRTAKEVAFAMSLAESGTDGIGDIYRRGIDVIDLAIGDLSRIQRASNDLADLIYAKSNLLYRSGDFGGQISFSFDVIDSGLLDRSTENKGSLLYDTFLSIANAESVPDSSDYTYNSLLPSDYRSLDHWHAPAKADWCRLSRHYEDDPAIRSLWERRGIRRQMRLEMRVLAESGICSGA